MKDLEYDINIMDIRVVAGDFYAYASEVQNSEATLHAELNDWKLTPYSCLRPSMLVNSTVSITEGQILKSKIKKSLKDDGIDTSLISVDFDIKSKKLTINNTQVHGN